MNGGINGKIIYKWAIFHGYVTNNQRVDFEVHVACHIGPTLRLVCDILIILQQKSSSGVISDVQNLPHGTLNHTHRIHVWYIYIY